MKGRKKKEAKAAKLHTHEEHMQRRKDRALAVWRKNPKNKNKQPFN